MRVKPKIVQKQKKPFPKIAKTGRETETENLTGEDKTSFDPLHGWGLVHNKENLVMLPTIRNNWASVDKILRTHRLHDLCRIAKVEVREIL